MPSFRVGERDNAGESETDSPLPPSIEEALKQPDVQKAVIQEAQDQGIPLPLLKAFMPGQDFNAEEMMNVAKDQVEGQDQGGTEMTGDGPQAAGHEPETPGKPPGQRELQTNPDSETQTMPETKSDSSKEFSADELISVIDDIIDIHGEEMTLAEFRDWADNNKDLIENFASDLV
jgi:hypothetical protein